MKNLHEFRRFAKNPANNSKEYRILLNFWICSGAKACISCRSRKMLQNAPTLAIVAVHTAENGPSKVHQVMNEIHRNIGWLCIRPRISSTLRWATGTKLTYTRIMLQGIRLSSRILYRLLNWASWRQWPMYSKERFSVEANLQLIVYIHGKAADISS